jgi:hypothetical protein
MNTRAQLNELFPPGAFENYSYGFDGQPFYHFERPFIARFWRAVFWALPPGMQGFYMVFLRKAGVSPATADPWTLAANTQQATSR